MKRLNKCLQGDFLAYWYECDGRYYRFEPAQVQSHKKEGVYDIFEILRENKIFTLTIKETEKCIFYEMISRKVGEDEMFVKDLDESMMRMNAFLKKDFDTYEIYDSEDEEFFVFKKDDTYYMPCRKSGLLDIVYKTIHPATLEKYNKKYSIPLNGHLCNLDTDASALKKSVIRLLTPDHKFELSRYNILKWAEKKTGDLLDIYVENRDGEKLHIQAILNEWKDIVTYKFEEFDLHNLTLDNYLIKVNKKMTARRKGSIADKCKMDGGFGWLVS
jgi:hypothetical protein